MTLVVCRAPAVCAQTKKPRLDQDSALFATIVRVADTVDGLKWRFEVTPDLSYQAADIPPSISVTRRGILRRARKSLIDASQWAGCHQAMAIDPSPESIAKCPKAHYNVVRVGVPYDATPSDVDLALGLRGTASRLKPQGKYLRVRVVRDTIGPYGTGQLDCDYYFAHDGRRWRLVEVVLLSYSG